jgi:hypothetical protein
MTWVFVVLIALAVVLVALVVVGRITGQLSAEPTTSYVDLDDAVAWVGDNLSADTAAQISYDDVRSVLGWYLDYLANQGIARSDDIDPAPVGPLMADENDALAWVLGCLAAAGDDAPPLTDDQVVEICDIHRAYLLRIGAVRSIDP